MSCWSGVKIARIRRSFGRGGRGSHAENGQYRGRCPRRTTRRGSGIDDRRGTRLSGGPGGGEGAQRPAAGIARRRHVRRGAGRLRLHHRAAGLPGGLPRALRHRLGRVALPARRARRRLDVGHRDGRPDRPYRRRRGRAGDRRCRHRLWRAAQRGAHRARLRARRRLRHPAGGSGLAQEMRSRAGAPPGRGGRDARADPRRGRRARRRRFPDHRPHRRPHQRGHRGGDRAGAGLPARPAPTFSSSNRPRARRRWR